MVNAKQLTRLSPWLYELGTHLRDDMRVPARIYADDDILRNALADRSAEQLMNTTTLPGVVGHTMAMPDVHQGYGFPIGGVAATALPEGVISPGGVGYDINCGVRVLTSDIQAVDLRRHMDALMTAIYRNVPVGVGASGGIHLSNRDLDRVLEQGSRWAVANGYGEERDTAHTEEGGCMASADAGAITTRARERGRTQLGSLGAGNHFIEVDEIAEIYDETVAEAFGLVAGTVCVWIHCGSRGLGHQVCSDAVRALQPSVHKYGITLPDRELVCAPFASEEGQAYFAAMSAAANYAWANRQVITHQVRRAFDEVLDTRRAQGELGMLYDVCHNIAKVETHTVDGAAVKLCVHRKGATRAYGPGRIEVPAAYRRHGQPVLIPGDMATGSYILVGTETAMTETFGSSCHGAGRVMSRSKARKTVRGDQLRQELEANDIVVRAKSMRGLAEEAPTAYKDLSRVVSVVHSAGIATKVVRTVPMGVIKG